MLDIFNHLAVFGIWFVVCLFIDILAIEEANIESIVSGLKLTMFTFIPCEILAWSIWYLSGAGV